MTTTSNSHPGPACAALRSREAVKARKYECNMTYPQLAALTGKSVNYLKDACRGRYPWISQELADKIEAALDCPGALFQPLSFSERNARRTFEVQPQETVSAA